MQKLPFRRILYCLLWFCVASSLQADELAVLLKQLEHRDSQVRYRALKKLAGNRSYAQAAMPVLIRSLKDPGVRRATLGFLQYMDADTQSASPALCEILKDKGWYFRREAIPALVKIGQPAVPDLIKVLKHKDVEARGYAVEALGEIGPDAKLAIPALIEALKDYPNVHHRAIKALGKMGPLAKTAVPQLLIGLEKAKGSNGYYPREATAIALGKIGPEAHSAIPALIRLLNKEDSHIRIHAAEAILNIQPKNQKAMDTLIYSLQDTGYFARLYAAEALGRLAPAARQALPALKRAAGDKKAVVRLAANAARVKIDPNDKDAVRSIIWEFAGSDEGYVARRGFTTPHRTYSTLRDLGKFVLPELLVALKDDNSKVRYGAVLTIMNLKSKQRESCLDALIESLDDPEEGVRKNSAIALSRIGSKSIPGLLKAIRSKNPKTRIVAARALGYIYSRQKDFVPPLIRAMRDPDFEVRKQAVLSLKRIGPIAKDAEAVLLEALEDKRLWSNIAAALKSIGSDSDKPVKLFIKHLNNEDDQMTALYAIGALGENGRSAVPLLSELLVKGKNRDDILDVLGWIGPEAAPAVPAITQCLDDSYDHIQALTTLGKIGPQAKAAVPSLVKNLKNKDHTRKYYTILTLGQIGTEAKDAVPGLIEALNYKDLEPDDTGHPKEASIRTEAIEALWLVAPEPKKLVPIIIKKLDDPHSSVKYQAVVFLANVGPGAEKAIPKLKELAKGKDNLSWRSRLALEKIGAK